jgi:hypothetical protein
MMEHFVDQIRQASARNCALCIVEQGTMLLERELPREIMILHALRFRHPIEWSAFGSGQ